MYKFISLVTSPFQGRRTISPTSITPYRPIYVTDVQRSPSAPPSLFPDSIQPIGAQRAVSWIKNYNPESSSSKLPPVVYDKRFQMARLDYDSGKKGVGSGILISDTVIMTTRHCIEKRDLQKLSIRFGINKSGDKGDPAYSIKEVHDAGSEFAVSLGLKSGSLSDLVLLSLDVAGRDIPGQKYGYTPIKSLSEAHAESGLYLLDFASGRHLKASSMLTRPVTLSKCLLQIKEPKSLEGKPVFWNGGQQYGRILSIAKNKTETFVWVRVESDGRSNLGYSDKRFRVSFEEGKGVVYNQNGETLKSDFFVGQNILFGTDHIVVAHKAFSGGSGGILFTEEGDIFAVLRGVLDSVPSEHPHHLALRPDIFQKYPHLYRGYMTLETLGDKETERANFQKYVKKANAIFSTGTSRDILYIAFKKGVELPDRVGGHDENRNQIGGNQIGASQSAHEHGINQAKQWTRFKDALVVSKSDQAKYNTQLKELDKADFPADSTTSPSRTIKKTGQRHSEQEAIKCAATKEADKTLKANTKKERFLATLNQ